MTIHQPIPVIATGQCYAAYLTAARTNLETMLRLATGLRDKEAEREAQAILDSFDDAAIDLNAMIAEANAPAPIDWTEQFWRESTYALEAGMGQ